jgi:hypothetical protein
MSKFLYKLTNENGDTFNYTHWSEGTKHEIAKKLRDNTKPLCSEHYIHAYENPLVAVFMNPIHSNFKNPILWQATGWVQKRDGQLKCGCFSLKTLKKIPLPALTTNQKTRAAIYCSLIRTQTETYRTWAANWLSGKDRSAHAAIAAATYAAAYAAAYAAIKAAAEAAYAATEAATYAATEAAYAATEAAAEAATEAAYAATEAEAAATEAAAAEAAFSSFSLIKILNRAIKEETA